MGRERGVEEKNHNGKHTAIAEIEEVQSSDNVNNRTQHGRRQQSALKFDSQKQIKSKLML